ncbi:MAG TPA: PQQ-dependent sugar dehydrogenase [Pyrinomonadaceae bacterium]|nr:PQQ-dependent sugar dehydrogenase [Pyrinomonadaceae bacterium]
MFYQSFSRGFTRINADLRQSAFICGLVFLLAFAANAASLPPGFTEIAISGLNNPTAMEIAPDGRIFVCQQGGSLRVIKNGVLLSTPFLSLSVDSNGERGLLGIAFDPSFASNNFLYVYYTVPSTPRHNRVSRFTANGDVVVPGSEQIILELDNLSSATNHNGGAIHFGPDGKLYVAVGENANGANAQTLSNRLGKVLRINSDGSIPTDNPFFNTAAGANRSIWALGLRNPFTFAFQPGTGRMIINDVGEVTWEEINDGIAGSNYGWNLSEGPTSNPQFRSPLFSYLHGFSATTGCAIAGGASYNPLTIQFPQSFVGKYFFADLCSGWIRVFDPSTGTASDFATNISNPVDLKVGVDGSLYYLARGSGAVFRVQFTEPMLISETGSDSAIALDSVTFVRDPFPLTTLFNFSSDHRTRLMLFGMNMNLLPGETSLAVTARAEDASLNVFPLTVEFVGPLPGVDGITQIVIRLPDNTPNGQTLFVSATLRGKTTNKVRVRVQ